MTVPPRKQKPRAASAPRAMVVPRDELRVYGLNAVRAVFARRPEAIRKLYLLEERSRELRPLLSWCKANGIVYRIVGPDDLQKLAQGVHHEGVVAKVVRVEAKPLVDWLRALPRGPCLSLWLDGVGNPNNVGAILRTAAHFGVAAVLLPEASTLSPSGAAARIAEGGAEAVPLVRLGAAPRAIAALRDAGFTLAATVVRDGRSLFTAQLPERLVYVLGAEGSGMDRALVEACSLQLSIPGTGAVESLNVAAATAVLLAEWARHHGQSASCSASERSGMSSSASGSALTTAGTSFSSTTKRRW